MAGRSTTTKSGLVLLQTGSPRHARNVASGSGIGRHPGMKSLLTVALILIGIVSTPVSCALADGPHSIFVDPVTQVKTLVHVHQPTLPATTAESGTIEDRAPSASELPESVTLLVALAADLPSFSGDLPAASQRVSFSEPMVPTSSSQLSESPPPR